MRKILPVLGLPVLGVVPLMSGIAMAAQPLIDQQMDGETAGAAGTADASGPPLSGFTFITFCAGPCPPPPPNAPPSAQFSYMLTINGIGLPTNGISLQALLVRP